MHHHIVDLLLRPENQPPVEINLPRLHVHLPPVTLHVHDLHPLRTLADLPRPTLGPLLNFLLSPPPEPLSDHRRIRRAQPKTALVEHHRLRRARILAHRMTLAQIEQVAAIAHLIPQRTHLGTAELLADPVAALPDDLQYILVNPRIRNSRSRPHQQSPVINSERGPLAPRMPPGEVLDRRAVELHLTVRRGSTGFPAARRRTQLRAQPALVLPDQLNHHRVNFRVRRLVRRFHQQLAFDDRNFNFLAPRVPPHRIRDPPTLERDRAARLLRPTGRFGRFADRNCDRRAKVGRQAQLSAQPARLRLIENQRLQCRADRLGLRVFGDIDNQQNVRRFTHQRDRGLPRRLIAAPHGVGQPHTVELNCAARSRTGARHRSSRFSSLPTVQPAASANACSIRPAAASSVSSGGHEYAIRIACGSPPSSPFG